MVGHAHSISLSPYVSIDLALSRTKRYTPCLSPIRLIHIVYSLTHIVYLGHSLQPVSLFRSHDDPHSLNLSPFIYVIDWPCFLQRIKYIYMYVAGSSLKLYLTALTLPKSSIRQYLSRAYICFQWMLDHTHFVSLSICVSIDLAFSCRIFHTLNLPLHPLQSRSYLHCEGDSNLGLICVGIYSGGRLYFRSIRPTTTPNTVATHATPLVDFPLARSSLSRTSFLAFNVAPWYYSKNYVVLFNYYK